MPESDINIRGLYHYIADGNVCTNSWYRDLDKPDKVTDVARFVESRKENVAIEHISFGNAVENRNEMEILMPEGEVSYDESDSEVDDTNEILNKFVTAIDTFKAKVISSYKGTIKKGVKYFTKKMQTFSKQNETSLEKSLFSIGKEINKPKTGGKRRKIGKLIPVQVTAKSRREYKHRGRVVGNLGRRPKDQEERSQMVVRVDNDNVYHTLPKQKKVKNKQIHSLKHSVDMNKPAAKKH